MVDTHERYTVEIQFTVCEGLRDKVLDEIKALRNFVEKNSLDHASDIKTYVRHEPIVEKKELESPPVEDKKETQDGTIS